MMKYVVGLLLLAVAIDTAFANNALKCSLDEPAINTNWVTMEDGCKTKMREQIQKEIDASYQYLAMAAHFSRDTINRPGFAEHFFKAAKEEREHGSKLVEYLSMRGYLTSAVTKLIKSPTVKATSWEDGVAALEGALNLEIEVTEAIRELIKECDKAPNDYHLVDYLTGVYLEEQLHGQRDLAGKISTLKKMKVQNGELGEFLFDKNL